MVTYKEIQASNALINDETVPRVAVFVGGTSGIGKTTIKALAATGAKTKIYIVGRKSAEERTRALTDEIHTINSNAQVIFTEGEVSLLAETKRICQEIKSNEKSVDLLFMTTGYAPWGARQETAEGIEITQSLEYYTRILFILHLLPLMRNAKVPRVVSVLAGGQEGTSAVNLDDLDLEKPGNFSGPRAQFHYATMNSTTMEQLAHDHPEVTFIHSYPGWVNTGNVKRGRTAGSISDWLISLTIEPIITYFGAYEETSGEKHLFLSTSAYFGGRGIPWEGEQGVNTEGRREDGLFLAHYKGHSVSNAKVMAALRETSRQRVWDHTREILKPYM